MVRLSVIAAAAAALGSASTFTVPTGAPLLRPAHRAHGVRALQAQQRDDSAAGISRRETIFRAACPQGVISDTTALSQLSILEDAHADLFEKVVPSVCYVSTEYTGMANQLNLDASPIPKDFGTRSSCNKALWQNFVLYAVHLVLRESTEK
jgi:hypothetical protein